MALIPKQNFKQTNSLYTSSPTQMLNFLFNFLYVHFTKCFHNMYMYFQILFTPPKLRIPQLTFLHPTPLPFKNFTAYLFAVQTLVKYDPHRPHVHLGRDFGRILPHHKALGR